MLVMTTVVVAFRGVLSLEAMVQKTEIQVRSISS